MAAVAIPTAAASPTHFLFATEIHFTRGTLTGFRIPSAKSTDAFRNHLCAHRVFTRWTNGIVVLRTALAQLVTIGGCMGGRWRVAKIRIALHATAEIFTGIPRGYGEPKCFVVTANDKFDIVSEV